MQVRAFERYIPLKLKPNNLLIKFITVIHLLVCPVKISILSFFTEFLYNTWIPSIVYFTKPIQERFVNNAVLKFLCFNMSYTPNY